MICGIIIPFTFESEKAEPNTKTTEYNESSFAPYSERDGWGFAKYKNKFDSLFDYFADKQYIITVKAVDWNMEVISTELSSASIHKAYEKVLYEVTEIDGYTFDGWYDETGKVSDDLSYEHTVIGDKLLTAKYIKEPVITTMYSTTGLNVRVTPDLGGEIVTTVPANYAFKVIDHDDENIWDMVEYEGARYFVAREFLSREKTVYATSSYVSNNYNSVYLDSEYKYYIVGGATVSEEIEQFLYSELKKRGITQWYYNALRQVFGESRFNVYAENKNGLDKGLLQYRTGRYIGDYSFWRNKCKQYGLNENTSIFDWRAQIVIYAGDVQRRIASGFSERQIISRHMSGDYLENPSYVIDWYADYILGISVN